VNSDDRSRARRNCRFDLSRIDVVAGSLAIHENRPRPKTRDRSAGGEESKWRGDDLVTRFYVERHQGEQQRV